MGDWRTVHKAMASIVIVMCGVLILPAFLAAMLSIFMFDAPGSESSTITVVLAFALVFSPFLFAAGLYFGIRALRHSSLHSLKIGSALLCLSVLTIGSLIWLLDAACGGSFVCS
jgi:hypothetical protein